MAESVVLANDDEANLHRASSSRDDALRVPAVRPLSPAIGAEIEGIDLRSLDDVSVAVVRRALIEHLVVFFRDQDISAGEQVAFAAHFGRVMPPVISKAVPGPDPAITVIDETEPKGRLSNNRFHADTTYLPQPPLGTVLRAVQLPSIGGDTCWASMYAAYDALSSSLQRLLDGLTAVHSTEKTDRIQRRRSDLVRREDLRVPVTHPVVRVHPESGRKALYVNRLFTGSIAELSERESDTLLGLLFSHVLDPEFQVRFHWEPGCVAFWDNRATQHCAVPDYHERRVMWRCLLSGDRPVGPQAAGAALAGPPGLTHGAFSAQ